MERLKNICSVMGLFAAAFYLHCQNPVSPAKGVWLLTRTETYNSSDDFTGYSVIEYNEFYQPIGYYGYNAQGKLSWDESYLYNNAGEQILEAWESNGKLYDYSSTKYNAQGDVIWTHDWNYDWAGGDNYYMEVEYMENGRKVIRKYGYEPSMQYPYRTVTAE